MKSCEVHGHYSIFCLSLKIFCVKFVVRGDVWGYLLKSVPPPLDSKHWYIIYEENNVKGNFEALFFDKESLCVSPDGKKTTCSTDTFVDATKVHV